MIRASTSNRCGTCKARKVKCDENWPVCGPCERGKRSCPGPPSRIKFVDSQSKEQPNGDHVSTSTSMGGESSIMITVQSRPTKHGSFRKMRLLQLANRNGHPPKEAKGALPRAIPPSQSEAISYGLAASYKHSDVGYRLFPYGERLADLIVQRIGHSAALDSAVDCVVHAYSAMRRQEPSTFWIDGKLYAQALHRLQKSLESPSECYMTETLCATLILIMLESRFGKHSSMTAVIHAGGMAKLLEQRGPCASKDPLFVPVVTSASAGIMNYAFTKGKDSILTLPEWQEILSSYKWQPGAQAICARIPRYAAFWPTFARQVADCRKRKDPVTSKTVLRRIRETLFAMEEMEVELGAHLSDESWAVPQPSTSPQPLFPLSFKFPNSDCAIAYAYHATFSIALRRMIGELDDSPESLAKMGTDILFYSQRIWMTFEFAQSQWPLGSEFMITPLMQSLESAPPEMVPKLVEALDYLEMFKGKTRRFMNAEIILYTNQCSTGRADFDLEQYQRYLATHQAKDSSMQESA